MSGSPYPCAQRVFVGVAALVLLTALVPTTGATTFPGRNGEIALAGGCGRIGLATESPRKVRWLTNPCPGNFDLQPSYSPNGRLIVFVRDQIGETELRIIRANGERERHLLGGANSGPLYNPTFLPQGRIAFTGPPPNAMSPTNNADTYVKKLGSPGYRRISRLEMSDYAPHGRTFVAIRNDDLILVSHRTGEPIRRLTHNNFVEFEAAFSPRGHKIAFVRKVPAARKGKVRLMLMGADGSGIRPLVFVRDSFTSPEFSPDGRWIAYCEDQAGEPISRDIVAVLIRDPQHKRVIADAPSSSGLCDPSWQSLRAR